MCKKFFFWRNITCCCKSKTVRKNTVNYELPKRKSCTRETFSRTKAMIRKDAEQSQNNIKQKSTDKPSASTQKKNLDTISTGSSISKVEKKKYNKLNKNNYPKSIWHIHNSPTDKNASQYVDILTSITYQRSINTS